MSFMEWVHFVCLYLITRIVFRAVETFASGSWISQSLGAIAA